MSWHKSRTAIPKRWRQRGFLAARRGLPSAARIDDYLAIQSAALDL